MENTEKKTRMATGHSPDAGQKLVEIWGSPQVGRLLARAYELAGVHPSQVHKYHRALEASFGNPDRGIEPTERPKPADFSRMDEEVRDDLTARFVAAEELPIAERGGVHRELVLEAAAQGAKTPDYIRIARATLAARGRHVG